MTTEAMRGVGPIVSIAGHTALLAWGLTTSAPDPADTSLTEALPVELVTLAEFTDLTRGVQNAPQVIDSDIITETPEVQTEQVSENPGPAETPVEEPQPEPEPEPAREAVVTPPPPPPEPPVEPEPQPEREPVEVAEPEPQAEPEPVEVARVPEPDAIDNLIQESLEQTAEPEVPSEPEEVAAPPVAPPPRVNPRPRVQTAAAPPQREREDLLDKREPASNAGGRAQEQASLGTRTGRRGAAMTQNELDSLVAQVRACWNPPAATVGNNDFSVEIRMEMQEDGSLRSRPVITGVTGLTDNARRAAEGAASRAVQRCAPYSLPIAKYDAWRTINVIFTPS